MFDEELSSFVSKFHQLRRAGLTAHLDVDTCAGKAWVGLRVMLDPVQHPNSWDQPHNVPNLRRRSPSYFRRQERRKAARAAADGQAPSSVVIDAEQAKETVKVSENKVEDSEKKETEQVSNSEHECELCDFSSNRKSGLSVHMARKHALIEQLDGSVDLNKDSRDVDHDEEIEQYLKTGKLGVHNLAWDRLLEWLKWLGTVH